jgi:hypothetical protein
MAQISTHMKHLIFSTLFALSLAMFAQACANKQADAPQLEIAKSAGSDDENFKGKILSDHPVMMMALHAEKYSWEDLDAYYRAELPKEASSPTYQNLRNMAFTALVSTYDLPSKAPQSVVAFYVDEQSAIAYSPAVKEYLRCLDALVGYWPTEKIKQSALDRFEKTKRYYQENALWQKDWEAKKSKYEPLLHWAPK